MRIGFIGAGKVGFTLGKYFREHGIEVTGYYSRSIQSASEAAEFTATNVYTRRDDLLAASDVLFFTLPDKEIESVYRQVSQLSIRGKIFCHCSGALSAQDAFPNIDDFSATGFSVHPLFAVSDKYNAYRDLADVFFTLEGSTEKLAFMQTWLQGIGLQVRIIPAEVKVKYHCAAALASNYVLGLLQLSQNLLTECGFSPDEAEKALKPLFCGNAEHFRECGLTASLTGPLERGDLSTLQHHLTCLTPAQRQLYVLLAKELLQTAKEKHPQRNYTSIARFLEAQLVNASLSCAKG